jgi:hypothetical protein
MINRHEILSSILSSAERVTACRYSWLGWFPSLFCWGSAQGGGRCLAAVQPDDCLWRITLGNAGAG